MHTIETIYEGNLRTVNKHLKSGEIISTDAPVDNSGKGEAFSPTDLVATGLTSCILTIAGMVAQQHGFSINNAKAKTTKIMSKYSPRKIDEIYIEIDLSESGLNTKQQSIIKQIPENCPVSHSLDKNIKQNINFIF